MADNDRLEREIEEILGKIEQFPPPESRARRRRQRAVSQARARIADWQQGVVRQLGRVSLSQLMLLSFLVILASFFFRGRMIPAPLATWLLVAGVILFISTFSVTVFGSRGSTTSTREQRWRGRSVQQPRGPSLQTRIRHWWASRSRRR